MSQKCPKSVTTCHTDVTKCQAPSRPDHLRSVSVISGHSIVTLGGAESAARLFERSGLLDNVFSHKMSSSDLRRGQIILDQCP